MVAKALSGGPPHIHLTFIAFCTVFILFEQAYTVDTLLYIKQQIKFIQ